MKYVYEVGGRDLFDGGIGFVELWDFSRANENEESRIEAIATVASICYGKPPKDAKKLVERLWTESGGLPSSAFEFVRLCSDSSGDPISPSIENSLRNNPDAPTWDKMYLDVPNAYKQFSSLPFSTAKEFMQENIATFKIKVPIFLARQVMRHRQYSYQELSRRRAGEDRVPIEFWVPAFHDKPEARKVMLDSAAMSYAAYKQLLKLGVRQEVARAVLPLLTYTETWMMGDALAWKNYFKLRLDQHAQKEHRILAVAMLDLLHKHQIALWDKVAPGVVIDPSCDEE